jgi:hypothetical protein
MLGLLIPAVLGFFAGRASANATLRTADTSRWRGTLGAREFEVHRNGPSWAWSTGTGTGAELTATDAMRQALAFLNPASGASDAVNIRRADGKVSMYVNRSGEGWTWRIDLPDGSNIRTDTPSPSRSGAILDALLELQPST